MVWLIFRCNMIGLNRKGRFGMPLRSPTINQTWPKRPILDFKGSQAVNDNGNDNNNNNRATPLPNLRYD